MSGKIAHIANKINKFLMLRELLLKLWLSLAHLFSFGSTKRDILSRKDRDADVDMKIQFGPFRKFGFQFPVKRDFER
jgi:DNA polymerase sigma